MSELRLWGAAELSLPLFSPIRSPSGMPREHAALNMYVHLRRSTRKAQRGSGVMHTAVSREGASQEGGGSVYACTRPSTRRAFIKRVRRSSALLHKHHFRMLACASRNFKVQSIDSSHRSYALALA